jgi:tRNA (cytidine/uridine-2'-O-)-methyltransferase
MPMLHVALFEPEIPPNTGNIARLCAATGTPLHLIGRLGFRLDEPSLRRAGLDYWQHVDVRRHATLAEFESVLAGCRVFCFTVHATAPYTRAAFRAGDCLLFGSESRGLPPRGAAALCGAHGLHPYARRQGPQPEPGYRRRHRPVRGAPTNLRLVNLRLPGGGARHRCTRAGFQPIMTGPSPATAVARSAQLPLFMRFPSPYGRGRFAAHLG